MTTESQKKPSQVTAPATVASSIPATATKDTVKGPNTTAKQVKRVVAGSLKSPRFVQINLKMFNNFVGGAADHHYAKSS